MKKYIISTIALITVTTVSFIYYAYTSHGGDFGASFGGSFLGSTMGSMVGTSIAQESKSREPERMVVEEREQEDLTAEDVQENVDDLKRITRKDLNTLNNRINDLTTELNMIKKALDETNDTLNGLKDQIKECKKNIHELQR